MFLVRERVIKAVGYDALKMTTIIHLLRFKEPRNGILLTFTWVVVCSGANLTLLLSSAGVSLTEIKKTDRRWSTRQIPSDRIASFFVPGKNTRSPSAPFRLLLAEDSVVCQPGVKLRLLNLVIVEFIVVV
jgi:hypothetical protein